MSNSALREIIALARQIRGTDKSPGSWKRSLKLAGEQYRATHPNSRRVNKTSNKVKDDPQMYALYRGFMKQLHALKLKYYNAGLTFLKVKTYTKDKTLPVYAPGALLNEIRNTSAPLPSRAVRSITNPQRLRIIRDIPPEELMEEEEPEYVDDLLTLRRKRRKPEE